MNTADTVQRSGIAGYQALGKQVSDRTGIQLPGSMPIYEPLGSSQTHRKEDDYDDFWAENGISDTETKRAEEASFVGQKRSISTNKKAADTVRDAKDDEWENW